MPLTGINFNFLTFQKFSFRKKDNNIINSFKKWAYSNQCVLNGLGILTEKIYTTNDSCQNKGGYVDHSTERYVANINVREYRGTVDMDIIEIKTGATIMQAYYDLQKQFYPDIVTPYIRILADHARRQLANTEVNALINSFVEWVDNSKNNIEKLDITVSNICTLLDDQLNKLTYVYHKTDEYDGKVSVTEEGCIHIEITERASEIKILLVQYNQQKKFTLDLVAPYIRMLSKK